MLTKEHTTFYPVPVSEFNQLKDDIKYLRQHIGNQSSSTTDEREWLPRIDFLRLCGISASQFNIWKNQDKLTLNYVGKKLYVARTDVDRYFNGEFNPKR